MRKTILWIKENGDEIKRGLIGGFTIFSLATIFFTTDSSTEYNQNACLKWEYNKSAQLEVCSMYKASTTNDIPYGTMVKHE
ncbi:MULTISPECIES: hypothetical protein [unclassified Bacillus (in: firmicutes)]|uniref:hypothetical protein n=1 Tax=unclassified Bacillus (in: firmicutes) TaxID=185979 RepID=UPI000BF00F98|nr:MULTISPECIES: hypothetical protein [unclassified Bacillus (in: firmicutes)]PEJ58210.1 hypothetical protein CN692_07965 [Bacillus sp. AFS002410]PEL12086.1 hypothetical protein CN601_08765 [Bacillus sp. AFS017336]